MNLAIGLFWDQVWYCSLDWPGTHYITRLLQNTVTWLSLLNTQITGLRYHVQLKYLKFQNNKNYINLAHFRIYSQYKKETYHSTLMILLNLALMIFSSQNWIHNLSTLNPKLKGSSQLIKRVYLLTTPNVPSFQHSTSWTAFFYPSVCLHLITLEIWNCLDASSISLS